MRTKILLYNPTIGESLEEQLNKVLEELEKDNITIKDIKIMNEKKVLIIYRINKFI